MKLIRQIECFAFAIMVLFSSSYVMVGVHICGDQIQNIALFSKAERCAMEKQMPPCHHHESKPCCEDRSIVHDSQSFNTSGHQIAVAPVPSLDLVQPSVFISEVIPSFGISSQKYFNYDPPLLPGDLTVSLQVFLI
jgi:hypothetical protein